MPNITVKPSGKVIETEVGITLLEALLTAGEAIAHKCDSKAECGACHVFIQEGRKSVSRIQPLENSKLDSIVGVSSKSRLACQAIMGNEDITVELLGFGSGF